MRKPAMRLLATAALCIMLSSLAQAEPAMTPGQWETTVETSMAGMPFAMKPITSSNCLTQRDIDEGKYAPQNNPSSGCTLSNKQESGHKVSYDMTCAGPPAISGHYEFEGNGVAMQGKGVMSLGPGQTLTTNISSKRTGDCK
jgi:hypothetical protein